uniref:NRF domain-containing protein n=1 Tax=Bursaphelenchus xylophilus TaxID=6326 RepID=A0A1I7SSF4_BURXY
MASGRGTRLRFSVFFILLLAVVTPEIISDFDDVEIHLEGEELERLQNPSRYDRESTDDLGEFMSDFFADSGAQLVVDLDLFRDLWRELKNYEDSAKEGDVDYVQQAIDFMAPLQAYDVSAPCLADLSHFLWTTYKYARTAAEARKCESCNCTRGFKNEFAKYQWIFNVVDAMGKVPAAIFGGNNLWTGSWYTCRKVSVQKNHQEQKWNGQYCMARFQPYNKHNPLKAFVSQPVDPAAVCKNNITKGTPEAWSEEDKKCFDLLPLLNLGLCTPDTCTDYDVKKIIQFIYHAVEVSMGQRLVCNVNVQCSNARPESSMWNNPSSVAFSCLLLFIATLMVFGTLYDIYVERPNQEQILRRIKEDELIFGHEQSKAREALNRSKTAFESLLLIFSMTKNVEYIMDTRTEKGQITCLHGCRFLSMCWIIFGHTYYYICTSLTTDNLLQTLKEFPKQFYNQLVVQAPLAVDSFFFLSGLLTSYIFIGKIRRGQVRIDLWTTWFAYYIRRYIRLTPVYVMIMLLEVTIFVYISEGPFWRPIEPTYCINTWWVNLLYVNNFFKQDDSCMGWTWYMANDFQFYVFAPILIILLYKFNVGGVLVGVMGLIMSSLITLLITLQKGYPPAPILTSRLTIVTVLNDYWVDLYVKPYTRCGPYIVGCLVGYLLLEKSRPMFQLSRVKSMGCWVFFSFCGIYSVFGLFNYTKTGEITTFWFILYTLCGRPAFALFLGWIVFACETGYANKINSILSHKMFIPLSKTTFCAYLIHPVLLQTYYLSRPTAFHFTHSFQLLYMFFVAVFTSYCAALILALAFEVPVNHVDRIIFGDGKKKPKEPNDVKLEPLGPKEENKLIENGKS